MTLNLECHPATPVGEPKLPQLKRRKLRKGTQSCWECKRRKIRCTFTSPADSICDGCRSRRTKCVSQEFDNDGGRLPEVVGPSVRQNTNVRPPGRLHISAHEEGGTARPKISLEYETTATKTSCSSHLLFSASKVNGHDEICRVLRETWPTDGDLGSILSIPVPIFVLYHGIVCMPYSQFFSKEIFTQPKEVLQLPPSDVHPVIIARKLLLLASWLQGTPCGHCATIGSHLRKDYYDYACKLVSTVSKLVTSDDELVSSVEGIDRSRIDPDYMWLRLVLTDRYLSLMLGLPQGTIENVFATPEALSDCAGLERFERMLGVAAGLILQRNSVERLDLAYTQKIDALLQEAAASMPPAWWADSSVCSHMADNGNVDFQGSLRLVNQIAYHHLLIQLHLPYLLQSPSTPSVYDYSKMTAAIASRAILVQFIAFRASETSTAYCRGIDFISFTASMTLCLAHIECRRQVGNPSSAFHAFRHQRLSDRGLVERTLQIMDDMAVRNEDIVARKISKLPRPLLEIERDAALGKDYQVGITASSSRRGNAAAAAAAAPESQWTSENVEGASHGVFSVQIPYFGIIKIQHSQGDNTRCDFPAQPVEQFDPDPQVPPSRHHRGYEITTIPPANADWQSVPSFVDHLNSPIPLSQPVDTDPKETRSSKAPSLEAGVGLEEVHLLVPGLEAELEDWVLQGVDSAFFSSLIQ
ncbi:hypothetical protein PG984_003066 [Apiospora sp. TS-2023a]